ncbi:MAG TPA: ring-cleaving dioxygenase [Anaerolineales bacterium]
MESNIRGIHHVTAIASDPQRNLDFYTGVLGLRLVKLTVNFDAPDTYHFYFADGTGNPGTILTFFPWPGARQGVHGARQASTLAFSIPAGAAGFWVDRLKQHGVTASTGESFNEEVISFADPDGLQLELVAGETEAAVSPWEGGPVPAQAALRGFHGVTLQEEGYEATAALLSETFGFRLAYQAENRARFEAPSGQPGRRIDLVCLPAGALGRMGAGVVHHVAWRTGDEAQQLEWRKKLVGLGLNVTPVLDRQYFRSIYFREPGGVLFEIATDPPGFAIDESPQRLGTSLKLPPWFEPRREEISRQLPSLRLPASGPGEA